MVHIDHIIIDHPLDTFSTPYSPKDLIVVVDCRICGAIVTMSAVLVHKAWHLNGN